MSNDSFSLPENALTYINTVKDRCHDLIQYKIWNGIKSLDLKRWLNNFNGDLELYFAACILDALIYRSNDQTLSLASELFTKKLPNHLNMVGFSFNHYKCLVTLLKSSATNQLRLVSVSNRTERPGKSSPMILRDYKRKLSFKDTWFVHPDDVKKEVLAGVKTFIFIDDFLGTGSQFNSMYKNSGFQLLLKDCNSIYSPLVAHSKGIKFLREKHPELVIISAEFIDEKFDVFNYAFDDGVNNSNSARVFYNKLLSDNKFPALLEENQYGFGNLGLTYTFSHSCPDNCLNIIWDNNNGGWHPLIAK